MKVDIFTKLLLLLITLSLGIIALRPMLRPETALGGVDSYDYIRLLGGVSIRLRPGEFENGSILLDTRTGDLFLYGWNIGLVKPMGNIGKLGGPIQSQRK
jgi:hypothetical protein